MKEKYIYVILSSTHCGVGKFIRLVTGNKYNHASISLDPAFKKLYSFARYHEDAPLYAGFTEESPLRYKNNSKYAGIKIYKIPVTKKQYNKTKKYIKKLEKYSKKYVYNFLSAATFPFRKKIKINESYTCIEFIISILEGIGVIEKKKFYSFKDLEERLKKYLKFEGTSDQVFKTDNDWGNDKFLEKKGRVFNYVVVLEILVLFKRLIFDFQSRKKD